VVDQLAVGRLISFATLSSAFLLLLLGRLSGSDINTARHLNSLTKVALQS
jgi:hypothetical protein